MLSLGGEASQERDVDWRTELSDNIAFDAEPPGGSIGAAAIEPLGGFQPVAEFPGVGIKIEVLEDQRKRAGWRGVSRELMMVEIPIFGLVQAAHVDHANGGIRQVGFDGLPALDFRSVSGEENAAGQEFVFVGAAGMSEDGIDHVLRKRGGRYRVGEGRQAGRLCSALLSDNRELDAFYAEFD